ncbi:MAG: hypothetical protein GW938_15585 [Leptospira sp.]|nr:hypothetical protein [Leptospira sp.]
MSVKITDSGSTDIKRMIAGLKIIEDSEVLVGLIGNEDTELMIYAGAQEFGASIKRGKTTVILPERSWLRETLDQVKVQDRIFEEYERGIRDFFSGSIAAEQVMHRVGLVAVAEIRNRIVNNDPAFTPLADSTLAKKKGPGIMRESLRLFKAINYSINGKVYDVQVAA